MTKKVLAYDIGGTKVEVAVVADDGKIHDVLRVSACIDQGKDAFLDNLTRLGKDMLLKHPEVHHIGVASAGPLHAEQGVLLDPTNFRTNGKTWGAYPIVELLQEKMQLPVVLENDAASAALAEHWLGASSGFENSILLTLGTGIGTGIIHKGKLLGAGRGLHTEGGHMIVDWHEKRIRCGCGNFGCAEGYLSGKNFTARARKVLRRPRITSPEMLALAATGKPAALVKLFSDYADIMAAFIQNFVVLYAPEIVVFTGSFTAAHPLFLPQAEKTLKILLQRREQTVKTIPQLKISTLENHAGVLGAAYVALNGRR